MADELADTNRNEVDEQQGTAVTTFIAIKSLPMRSYARDLRLRELKIELRVFLFNRTH